MLENYLIIDKSILPDYYEKVLLAKRLLEEGKARDVSQAVRIAGISRSTYYKYRDYILEPSQFTSSCKAVLSVLLNHEPGVLSALLLCISDAGGSVLTISQSLPIRGKASAIITLDLSGLQGSISKLLEALSNVEGAENPQLVAIE